MSDEQLLQFERQYCSAGDTVHYSDPPKVFRGCEGSFLKDDAGVLFLDLQMSYSAVNFGYRNRRVEEAFKRQAVTLPQLAPQYLHSERVLLAKALSERMEGTYGKGRLHFEVGGAQAVETALKIVRNACGGKSLVFAFEGGYHGRTLGATAITSSYRYRRRYGHFGDRAQFIPYPYCFRCPYGKRREDCELFCVQEFRRLFDSEYHGVVDSTDDSNEFAAFVIEPIQGTGGYFVPPAGYFQALAAILRDRNILLVDDEIQMGFFRTGTFWSIENFGVAPDIIVFGKSLTNGMHPLSGVWAREPLLAPENFPPGSSHATYANHPLGTAAGLEVMRILTDAEEAGQGFGEMARAKGAALLAVLKRLENEFPQLVGHVDGLGMALRMEICEADRHTPNRQAVERMVKEALRGDIEANGERYGLVLDVGGYYKNVITIAPALTISNYEIELAEILLRELLRRLAVNS